MQTPVPTPRRLARGHPRRLCHHLGQSRVPVQDPMSKETFLTRGRHLSLGSEIGRQPCPHRGRLPLSRPADPSPGKVKSGRVGRGGTGHPAGPAPAALPAPTPMATGKYLFPGDGLQRLLEPNTRPPSGSPVIGGIKIDPLPARTWPCSGGQRRGLPRGERGAPHRRGRGLPPSELLAPDGDNRTGDQRQRGPVLTPRRLLRILT